LRAAAPGIAIVPGIANFPLAHLPANGPAAAELIARCRARGLFLRDAAAMGRSLGERAVRIAVKDDRTNARMLAILAACCARSDC
jgi:histidinol-phosphate/aromatic aminotransferase/cobyric acid decarboxylase-like protein